MRTTLTLDDDVASALAEQAKRSGQSFKVIVNEAIRLGLLQQSKRAESREPFIVRSKPLGLRPGLSYDNVEELLDIVEGPNRR